MSFELLKRYRENPGEVEAETNREARRLVAEARKAVREGWRPKKKETAK